METTKIERNAAGRAVAAVITVKIGRDFVTFREPIEQREVEAIARLRAEASVMRQALEAQAAKVAETQRTGFPSLLQWFEHWVHHRYDLGLWGRGISQKGREKKIRVIFGYCDEKWHRVPMDSFTPATLNRLVNEVASSYATSTTVAFIDVIKPMFEDAVKYGWENGSGDDVPWRAKSNPSAFVRKPEIEKVAKRTLTADELFAILEASTRIHGGMHWTTRAMAFEAVLGLRIGESVLLRWEQITLTPDAELGGFITWRPNQRKGGVGLRLPIPRALLRYLPPIATEGRVFTTLANKTAQMQINDELRAAAAAVGIDPTGLTSHSLRHSFAHAVFAQKGVVTADLTRAMGHTSESTTRRYLRDVDDLNRISDTVAMHAGEVLQ